MTDIGFNGTCPNDGSKLAVRLEPTDTVVSGLMPDPDRIIDMFDVEAYCQECEEWVEPDGLRASA